MTYRLVPNPTDFILKSQKDFQVDFELISDLFSRNHFGFDSENFGKHSNLTLRRTPSDADPTTAANEIVLYCRHDDFSLPQVFLRQESDGAITQMTPLPGIYAYAVFSAKNGDDGDVPIINNQRYNIKNVYRESIPNGGGMLFTITFSKGTLPTIPYVIKGVFVVDSPVNFLGTDVRVKEINQEDNQIVLFASSPLINNQPKLSKMSIIVLGF